MVALKSTSGSVQAIAREGGYVGIGGKELLELDVDILIPAALENQIHIGNVQHVKAPIIVEVANGPIASDADPILAHKDVLVVPDILANAGGVVVSYLEWVQNNTGFYWKREEVHRRLEEIMVRAFSAVYTRMDERDMDMRTAAYVQALQRIHQVV